jgi:thiol-disulfide isomerase/thioredoxin
MGLFSSRISQLNNHSTDSDKFVGEFSWEVWKKLTGWSDNDVEDYIHDDIILSELKFKLQKTNIQFLFFVAEWCGDSHSAAPTVMSLFKLLEISNNLIKLIGVSRDKMSPDPAFRNKIDSIPTLLVQIDEYEIGRIEEYPAVSWEYDLLKILSDF